MDELGFSSLNDLGRLSSMPLFTPLTTTAEEQARKLKHFATLTAKYAPAEVIVGEVSDVWEDYSSNKLHATIEYPVQDTELTGVRKVECYIGVATSAEVVRMTQGIYDGRVLVVDKETKQILASYSSYFLREN